MRKPRIHHGMALAVLLSLGAAFAFAQTPPTWVSFSGKATDVGVGANGALWVVGTDPAASPAAEPINATPLVEASVEPPRQGACREPR